VASERVERRLTAILAADIAGYSRLMGADEEGTLAQLKAHRRALIDPKIDEHRGRVVKTTGDGMLAEFASVVDALRCAVEVQRGMIARNAPVAHEKRIEFRVGINVGDIIIDGGDIYGDGVNVAARLEAVAEPGGICVSGRVFEDTQRKVDVTFRDAGEQHLKNITRPVRVYRVEIGEESTTQRAAPAFSLPDKPSIAVLPFNNMSGDPAQEYFADGVVEEITTALSRIHWLFVIARNSSFTYKGRAVDVKQVGRELGVRYVLEGSVRRSGGRVRVTAQLIEADTGHHLVAETYDREVTDLFELQDEIATTIAGAIEPEVLKYERDRIASRPRHDQDAYELYQRGLWHHYRHSKADNAEAQACFRRALAIAPEYAQAMASLGLALCNAAFLNWSDDPERCYRDAFELAQRAITLDPRDAVAHFTMGAVCMWTSRFDRSMAEMKEAIKLNPSFAAAHCILGYLHVYAGHPEEAIPLAEKGIRLSPNDPRLFMWLPALAAAHYQLRHYEQAIEIGLHAWDLRRSWAAGLRYVVAGLAQLGRIEEAQAALADLKGLDDNLAFVEGNLRRLYKDQAGADHILEGLRKAGFE
jgi:adenylate cyclase